MQSSWDRLKRAPGQADADAVLADDRRGHHGRLLVPAGALPGLPHHRRCRPAEARLTPRRGCDGANAGAVVPIMPAERAVRRARLSVQVERCRGVLRGAQRQ